VHSVLATQDTSRYKRYPPSFLSQGATCASLHFCGLWRSCVVLKKILLRMRTPLEQRNSSKCESCLWGGEPAPIRM